MSYAYQQAPARAGELGKGNLASAKTTAEKVAGAAVKAGDFVALDPAGGVKALAAKTDVIAGVVLASRIRDEWGAGELVDVMHIATADAIWVVIAEGEKMARGDKVYVVAVANGSKKAGTIQGKADATNAIATNYNVIDVKGQLALITQL